MQVLPGVTILIPAHGHASVEFWAGARAILFGVADDFLLSRVLPALGVSLAPYWHDFHSPKNLSHWTSPSDAPERNRLWEELPRAQRRLGTLGDAAVSSSVILDLFEKYNILSRGVESLGSLPVANAFEDMPHSELDLVTSCRDL